MLFPGQFSRIPEFPTFQVSNIGQVDDIRDLVSRE